ncbi:methyl-accepting chemotaxis protein [Venatoribacter cucullus]|uniref:methyl-accepting chemotaxis protein n=1 Tax=Venatoribacter cucullus TaxID=2661630 RepID=UPI00223F1C45|nr:methyl-accepting chemotaxis protein [Venatoribacter cucullus]UZK02773.1 HAMP domain-containing protein [Venatoribacter cucullus]
MSWSDLSLRKKLLVPIALVGILMLVLSALQISTLNRISAQYSSINEIYIPAIELTLNADRDMFQAQIAERTIASGLHQDAFLEMHKENLQQVADRLQKIQQAGISPAARALAGDFLQQFSQWRPRSEELVQDAVNFRLGTATVMAMSTGELDEEFERIRTTLDKLGEFLGSEAQQMQQQAQQTREQAMSTIAMLLLVALLLVVIAGVYFPRLITRPVNELARVLAQMAGGRGDLRHRMPELGKDELGQLSRNFNQFLQGMQHMIGTIRDVGTDVAGNSQNLDSSASESQRISQAYEDAMSLVATANHEMSLAIQEVSVNTQQVSEEAKHADKSAREVSGKFQHAMEEIQALADNVNHSGEVIQELVAETTNIASVLDVIKGIAEQTNLLALNAAIEAARAGEQGRGFAVVADEVRTLASKTQQSTGDINVMIEKLHAGVNRAVSTMSESQKKAVKTVEFASESEGSVRGISTALQSISDRILQIASAIEEQTSVINEINSNLSDAKELSSQGSDSAARINQAVISLNEQAQRLQEEISNFSL